MVEINGYKFNLTKKQAKQKLQIMLLNELQIILLGKELSENLKTNEVPTLCGLPMIEIDWQKLKVNYPVFND